MKKENQFKGFIECEDSNHPYDFDGEWLIVFPLSEKERKTNIVNSWNKLSKASKNEWIPCKVFNGSTADGYSIVFWTINNPKINGGFYKYQVIWYAYFSGNIENEFRGIQIQGDEIDCFYRPDNSLETKSNMQKSQVLQSNFRLLLAKHKTLIVENTGH